MTDLSFACDCGKVTGVVHDCDSAGLNIECFCDSCRAAANICDPAREKGAPVPLFLTYSDKIDIQGIDLLEPLAFGQNRIVRWRTTCCGNRMFSTQPSPKLGFISVAMERVANPADAGAIRARAHVPQPGGKAKHENGFAFVPLAIGMFWRRFTGAWRKTQLYNTDTLEPIAPVKIYSREEKKAALAP